MQDDRAPARGDRLTQRVDVERDQAAQIEDADGVALLGGAVGGALGDDDRGAVGDDDEVRPLAHDARLAQRDGVVLLGNLVLDQPVAAQRLAEEHRVGIADRLGQHPLRVARGRRHDDLQARRVGVLRLMGVGVQLGGAHVAAPRRTNDHRHGVGALRAVGVARDLTLDLVEGLAAEAQELQLGDRDHPAAGEADGRSDDDRLGQRHIDHALGAEALLQTLGGAEDAAVDADVLTEHDHALVGLQRGAERGADRLDHRHLGHQRGSLASRFCAARRCASARWASSRPGALA